MRTNLIYELAQRIAVEAQANGRVILSKEDAELIASMLNRYAKNYGALPRSDANKQL